MIDPALLIVRAKLLCERFIDKVESGRARSVETYADCKELLKDIEDWQKEKPNAS